MSASHSKLESGLQLLARLTKKQFIDNLYRSLFTDGHKPNDIIEIVGENGSGKSALVCDIISEAILPKTCNGTEAGVLFINTDGNACFKKLYQTLNVKVGEFINNSDNAEVGNEIVQRALSQLQIIEVDNPLQFYATLQNLESIISNHGNMSLLIIDTLTAYYWSEQNMKIVKMNVYVSNILKLIQKVTKQFQIVVMYTKPVYFNTNMENNHDLLSYRIDLNVVNSKDDLIYEATCFRNDFKYKKYFKFCNNTVQWMLQ